MFRWGSGWQWRLRPSWGSCALNRLQIHQNGVNSFLFRNDDGNSLQHSWGLLDVPGNNQNGLSSESVRLTHVETPYCWKCARGARAKLLRWEIWIKTVICILESLRKVPVHEKQTYHLEGLSNVLRANPMESKDDATNPPWWICEETNPFVLFSKLTLYTGFIHVAHSVAIG